MDLPGNIDKNVTNVIMQIYERSLVGQKKYGTTTERTDLSPLHWLQHLQEELMDACIYIETLKPKVNEFVWNFDTKTYEPYKS